MNYKDINDPGYSKKYHTGEICIEPGCNNPAGSAWSPFWCAEHNIIRMDRINGGFREIMEHLHKESNP